LLVSFIELELETGTKHQAVALVRNEGAELVYNEGNGDEENSEKEEYACAPGYSSSGKYIEQGRAYVGKERADDKGKYNWAERPHEPDNSKDGNRSRDGKDDAPRQYAGAYPMHWLVVSALVYDFRHVIAPVT